ncbi:carbohydrate ABC transporter permease [soil metagenome]
MKTKRRSPLAVLRKLGLYLLLTAVAALFVLPIAWTVSTSFKLQSEVLRFPPQWIPDALHWENYRIVFEFQPFAIQFFNSVYIAVLVCAITLVVSSLAGYAFARLNFPGKNVLFILVLSALFIPPEATIIPLFRTAVALGWYDTHIPLVVFTAFSSAGTVATFVMRQAFLTIPKEFEEAARIDGAGWFRTFAQVVLPMARPSLAAVVVLSAWQSWNQFLEPLVYLRSANMLTVPVALAQYTDPYSGPMFNVQAAATTLSIVPLLIIFMFAQRHIVAGLTAGGLK